MMQIDVCFHLNETERTPFAPQAFKLCCVTLWTPVKRLASNLWSTDRWGNG